MPKLDHALPAQQDAKLPSYERAEVRKAKAVLTLIDDLLMGPQHMMERAPRYIDPLPNEDPDVYAMRRTADVCFGGLTRTVNAGVGMVFGKEPSIVWGEGAMPEQRQRDAWDNLDGAGTKGTVMLAQFMANALAHGLSVLLVDHPPAPVDENGERIVVHAGNEADFNLRPLVRRYSRQQVRSWRTVVENGVLVLTQLVLREVAETQEGEYGANEEVHFRVLRLAIDAESGKRVATWQLWREVADETGKVRYESDGGGTFRNRLGATRATLPVAIAVTGYERAPFVVDPPLVGVAYANLMHYRYACELAFNRQICAYEQLVISGELKRKRGQATDSIELGALRALVMTQGGDAKWIGPSGSGLAQLESGKREKMEEMDKLGLGFLLPRQKASATATETRLDSYAQLASLKTTAGAVQDAMNLAWELIAWFDGFDKRDAPVLTLNTNFETAQLDAGVMQAYVALTKAGFPRMAVLVALQEGGRIPADADLDALALEWEATAAAEADIEREEREADREARDAQQQPPQQNANPETEDGDE